MKRQQKQRRCSLTQVSEHTVHCRTEPILSPTPLPKDPVKGHVRSRIGLWRNRTSRPCLMKHGAAECEFTWGRDGTRDGSNVGLGS